MNWQQLEDQVRQIAELHWSSPCKPETIHGIKCDGVIRVSNEEMVAIEITQEEDLGKLRNDVSKLNTIRYANFNQQILTRCYFITEKQKSSLKTSGEAQNINVMSVDEFAEFFLGTSQYIHLRSQREFGSSVDPQTGEPDKSSYTPIHYINEANHQKLNTSEVSDLILSDNRVVLLGEFGSGKSRCIREIFENVKSTSRLSPTLAINLRENWGFQSFDLIIRNHMSSLGLNKYADDMVKLVSQGRVKLLLDGFDEIGSQSWTGEAARLKEIRKKSLVGVKDLIQKCRKAGFIIAGREHYFSSTEEMYECLGLPEDCLILRCPEEFTEQEALEYVAANTNLKKIPDWMPRKPLICQLFTKIEKKDLVELEKSSTGEVDFFSHFFDAVCKREQRIHASIDVDVLKGVLLNLAVKTRSKMGDEELSPNEINESFYEVSGYPPLDESAIMLQRLPYLGRVSSGNPNRTFIDSYVKSGLRGLALINSLFTGDKELQKARWNRGVGEFGARVIAARVSKWEDARKYGRLCESHGNGQVSCDILCAELEKDQYAFDFTNFPIRNASASVMDFSNKSIKGLEISDSFIDAVDLENADFIDCKFSETNFSRVSGVATQTALPKAFEPSCTYDNFTDIDNSSRISHLPISNQHKTLLAIIQKLFFQRGRGRKEEALLRGSSGFWDENSADLIIQYMKKNAIIIEAPGKSGKLYIPQIAHKNRMRAIKDGMSTCHDELWKMLC